MPSTPPNNVGWSLIALGIIGFAIVWAANNPPAPRRTPRIVEPANPLAVTPIATTPAQPSGPDDIVKAHAPQSEIDFANAHLAFRQDVVAPNAIVREELRKQKNHLWIQAVLKVNFNEWAGLVSDIRSDARITIVLPSRLRVWADVIPNSALFASVRAMSDNNTPVLFSGHINKRSIAITADNDDDIFPTCFEDAFGITGCEIDLTSIRVIPPPVASIPVVQPRIPSDYPIPVALKAVEVPIPDEIPTAGDCVGVGTTDEVKPIPQSLERFANTQFYEGAAATTFYRCVNDRVYICEMGNGYNCDKPSRQKHLPGLDRYCKQYPNDDAPPRSATGHSTIYNWKCVGGKSVIINAADVVDSRGFRSHNWIALGVPK